MRGSAVHDRAIREDSRVCVHHGVDVCCTAAVVAWEDRFEERDAV